MAAAFWTVYLLNNPQMVVPVGIISSIALVALLIVAKIKG